MDAVQRVQIDSALKEMTLTVLNELVAHNIKGAELIRQGVVEFMSIKEDVSKHYETLIKLITLLKPVFEIARDWLVKCYSHLVAVFDWAKEMWQKIFGSK